MSEPYSYGNQPGQRLDLPEPTVATRGKGQTGMEYQIIGTTLQAAILELDPGETVYSEAGGMSWMSGNIQMSTNRRGGGLGGMFQRALTGESLFLNEFTSQGGKGIVAFASDFPGKIVPVALSPGQDMIVQRESFLCAEKTVNMAVHFRRKLGAGLFGGEGFILQKLEGQGLAFVHAGGTIVARELAAGETLRVDTGCLVAFEPRVTYDIQWIGGLKSALFGGEGLFFATLTGPGKIWLQSLPFARLARRIVAAGVLGGPGEGSVLGGAGLGS